MSLTGEVGIVAVGGSKGLFIVRVEE